MSEEGWEQKYIKEAFDTNLSKRVVALLSGTAAVHLGLLAAGVKPGG